MKSGFKKYSVGIVVDGYDISKIKNPDTRDRELSKHIEIYPIEHISQKDGKLDIEDEVISTTKDLNDNNLSTKVIKKSSITCHWIPMHGSNRYTPHVVTKGMTVIIYRFEDTDEYYWDTLYIEDDLKLGEYVSYAYKTDKNDYYTMSYDALNHEVILTTPSNTPSLRTLYEVFVKPEEDTAGIDMSPSSGGSSNKLIFTNGGKNMIIDIKTFIGIHTKLMQVIGDLTVNGVDVYKTLIDHEARIIKLGG